MKIAYHPSCSMEPDEWISLSKPRQVVRQCYHALYDNLCFEGPVDRSQLLLAHAFDYVTKIMALRADNGFGNRNPVVLEQILAANGSMIAGALLAKEHGVSFAPVSGFHHAHFTSNYGFCTFNGLVIAARVATPGRVLIIDGDAHTGDGTDDILRKTGMARRIRNLTDFGKDFTLFCDQVDYALKEPWDLVIYQAGADAHELDEFHEGYLSDDQWRERDELVFGECKRRGLPIVWNLAGGYSGIRTINLHYDTFVTACRIYEPDRPIERLSHASGNRGAA